MMEANLNDYMDNVLRPILVEGDQLEQLVSEHLHDLPSLFLPRVQGTATGEGRLGKINDFGTFAAMTHFRVVVVIQTSGLFSDT